MVDARRLTYLSARYPCPSGRLVATNARVTRRSLNPAVYELSRLLNTGLDRETLAVLMALLQKGVNPEALAAVVKDLRKEAAERRADAGTNASASASSATALESPRVRQFTGKQPLASDELQVSQVCLPSLSRRRVGGGRVIVSPARVATVTSWMLLSILHVLRRSAAPTTRRAPARSSRHLQQTLQ